MFAGMDAGIGGFAPQKRKMTDFLCRLVIFCAGVNCARKIPPWLDSNKKFIKASFTTYSSGPQNTFYLWSLEARLWVR